MDAFEIMETFFSDYGYWIVFLSAFIESLFLLGFLLPGGMVVLLGGYYAQQNQKSVICVAILAWLGMFLGGLFNYWLGKKGIHKFIAGNSKFRNLIRNYDSAENLIVKYGCLAIFYSHILGYMRSVICFSAGAISFPKRKYMITVLCASLFWSLLFVGLGYIFGESTKTLSNLSIKVTVVAWLIIILFVILKLMQRVLSQIINRMKIM